MVGDDVDVRNCDIDGDCDVDDDTACVDYDVGVGEHGIGMLPIALTLRVVMRR